MDDGSPAVRSKVCDPPDLAVRRLHKVAPVEFEHADRNRSHPAGFSLGFGRAGLDSRRSHKAPPQYLELTFEDRLGLLVDREADWRDSRRLATRLKAAKLRHQATVEEIDNCVLAAASSGPWS